MRLFFILTSLVIMFSCTDDNNIIYDEANTSNEKLFLRSVDTSITYLFSDFIFDNDGNFTVLDGSQVVYSGEKISGSNYIITNQNEVKLDIISVADTITNETTISARIVGNTTYLNISNFSSFFIAGQNTGQSDGVQEALNPCDQHPAGEPFADCFAREWQAFCEDLPTCIAQATNPIPIAVAIGIHCVSC